MRYQNVCIESLSHTLPSEIITSAQIERRLAPLYARLRLPEGRLELMTGIRERRVWPEQTLPSQISVISGEKALATSGLDRRHVGALIHASVCRDFLEPATAAGVHHQLGLPQECLVYDVSNACLGLLNGILQVANMIELGQIRAGLVVGTESSRALLENTIATLNCAEELSRQDVKLAIASLTIGSASAAVLLCDRQLSRTGNRLTAAAVRAHTDHHRLCHSGRDESVGGGMLPLMHTDSERLMHEGIATGAATFADFLRECQWSRDEIDKTFCHQVGQTHRRMMFEAFGLDLDRDFATLSWLGNTGSVAMPATMSIGMEQGFLQRGDRVAMLGIGSGINCLMLGVQWQTSPVIQRNEAGLSAGHGSTRLAMQSPGRAGG